MDGLTAVSELRKRGSKAVIVMCSTLTSHGATSTIDALMRGASDYVTKPAKSQSTDAALEELRFQLIPKLKQFFARPAAAPAGARPAPGAPLPPASAALGPGAAPARPGAGLFTLAAKPAAPPVKRTPVPPQEREIVAIGLSTGGPTALMQVLPHLPKSFPLPIVIVQHMPPIFTKQLAERLNTECALEVLEAAEGMALKRGQVLLAPGDYHMRLKRKLNEVSVTLDQAEKENSCRPAVDVLFRSVVEVYGGRALGVVLTGMGQDGLRGVEHLKQKNAYVIAQDRESSVVWGMPGAVVEAGLADSVLSLREVAPAMLRQVPAS
jgi:two-component system chemotaxis response regulator CheB